jgi:hypothetical protein
MLNNEIKYLCSGIPIAIRLEIKNNREIWL